MVPEAGESGEVNLRSRTIILIFRIALRALLILVLFIGTYLVSSFVYNQRAFRDMETNIPSRFPIVVMLDGEAHLMRHEDLERLAIDPGNVSFLLPPRSMDTIQAAIRSQAANSEVTLENAGEESQVVRVYWLAEGDEYMLGTYRATENSIVPLSFVYNTSGLGIMLTALPMFLLPVEIICILLFRRLLRSRKGVPSRSTVGSPLGLKH